MDAARQDVHELEHGDLKMPKFDGFADIARMKPDGGEPGATAIPDPALRAHYFDALLELHRLLEEYRFHVSLAHLLVLDIGPSIEAGLAEPRRLDPMVDAAGGMPDESRALLLPYMREAPSAVELFDEPHLLTTGGRRLSGWFGGQLIDDALVRGIAALDRIATMLWVRVSRPIATTARGVPLLPGFSRHTLDKLNRAYTDADWQTLVDLTDHVLFAQVKRIRNDFTHARRIASELHGERYVSRYFGDPMQGLDAGLHLALGVGFYALILVPAVDAARALLREGPEGEVPA